MSEQTAPTTSSPAAAAGANLDAVGIFWLTLMVSWTLLVFSGMAFLARKRHMPILRMRGLALSFAAITLLHLYYIAANLVYVTGPLWPNGLEFWIMSIWLPFGIALFHASNSRFLHVAQAQRRFVRQPVASTTTTTTTTPPHLRRWKRLSLPRFRKLDYSAKMLLFVSAGMLLQLVVALVMFLLSRKFHPSFGISGTEVTGTPAEQRRDEGRGWEWWPSVFWQFFWAWIVAPVILWRARGIHDTMGWRWQTIACCLAGLHATPMWLIALYVDGMAPVNRYFAPPQWIALSVMLIEIFTIFIPCWQVRRAQTLEQETVDTIAAWEAANKLRAGRCAVSVAGESSWQSLSSLEKGMGKTIDSLSSDKSYLMMEALEHTLAKEPEPLQRFSALQDFSGENIAFLRSVADWKTAARRVDPCKDQLVMLREHFSAALRIYVEFISPADAEFPVNLSWQDLKKIESIFGCAARELYGDKGPLDPIRPFDAMYGLSQAPNRPESSSSEKPVIPELQFGHTGSDSTLDLALMYWGEIPGEFDTAIFDAAETNIKYLVLTNTWPKFVKHRHSLLSSLDTPTADPHCGFGNVLAARCRTWLQRLSCNSSE